MSQPFRYILIVGFAFIALGGCTTKYATLYVNTQDKALYQSFSARVYSGNTGQFLLNSPGRILLSKSKFESNPTIVLIAEDDCYKTVWQPVTVSNWANTIEETYQPEHRNEALLLTQKLQSCTSAINKDKAE